MVVQDPWRRVRQPMPIPDDCSSATLTALDEDSFAELLRSNLVPRDQTPAGRRSWEELWRVLSVSDQLADRSFDVLEQFIDTTDEALGTDTLDDAGSQRAEKFRHQCDQAWNRLERDRSGHLAWAGRAGDFQPAAQRVIATLVGAIARHRSTTMRSELQPSRADERLWEAMRQVALDPQDYQ